VDRQCWGYPDGVVEGGSRGKANHRINGGTYEWVEDRHVLAVCTPAEIPFLMDVMELDQGLRVGHIISHSGIPRPHASRFLP